MLKTYFHLFSCILYTLYSIPIAGVYLQVRNKYTLDRLPGHTQHSTSMFLTCLRKVTTTLLMRGYSAVVSFEDSFLK